MKDLFPFEVFDDDEELRFYYPREHEGNQGNKRSFSVLNSLKHSAVHIRMGEMLLQSVLN
ncbi:hypothetical protein ACI2OX_15440 [Bacillus sp. N9]